MQLVIEKKIKKPGTTYMSPDSHLNRHCADWLCGTGDSSNPNKLKRKTRQNFQSNLTEQETHKLA
jgi:hypothetical protein